MARARPWTWLSCLLALSGCDACGREPKVPFKLGAERDAHAELSEAGSSDAEVRNFGSATDRPNVDGKVVPLDFVRALLLHDLDGDGDRDVIALVHDAVLRMRLMLSLRVREGFEEARDVPGFSAPGDASCTLQTVTLEAPTPDKAVLAITLACGDPQKSTPPNLTLLSLETPPRFYESLALLGEPGQLPFTLSASARDTDGDGQSDFVLQFSPPGESAESLSIALLDRAGGLSRDVREPETTFAAWASAAQTQLAKNPEQARLTAERVLRYEHALCREPGEAVLLVSGARGIPCGKSKAVANALAILALASEKLQAGPAALAAYAELLRRELKPDKRLWERLQSALANLPSEPGVSLREGPRVEPIAKPRVHLPSARFLDDERLLLLRASPSLYELGKNEESPLSAPPDPLVRDPSGQLVLTDLERDGCGSLRLRIERAPKALAPYLVSAPVSMPLALPSAAWAGLAPCKQSSGQGHVESGYQVLGWAPQGVVLARGAEALVVPLTQAGEPAGEPIVLPGTAPLPAPLPNGAASTDGARYAELTPFGVLVFERKTGSPALLRPDGFLALGAAARDLAISPSGRRLVLVANGSAYILTREAAP